VLRSSGEEYHDRPTPKHQRNEAAILLSNFTLSTAILWRYHSRMDAISEARLSLVWSGLADKIHQLATMLEPEGFTYRVTQGFRSWQEQDALYAQGRTAPGEIVTNARGGESWHCLGCAVDLAPNTAGTPAGEFVPDWNINHPGYARMIAVGQSLGLTSGASFIHLPDWPHLQYTNPYPVDAPNDEARSIYANEGATAFWSTLV